MRPTTTTALTLLIGGGRSPAYLGAAVAELARIIPGATAAIQPGLDHNAADLNAPDTVAGLVRAFLAAADAAP